jgi:hypothetical protein
MLQSVNHNECIEWAKAKDKAGYGVGWFRNKWMRAHRIAYIQSVGEIPPLGCIMHMCDNRACVNPAHLVLGTNYLNSRDMVSKNRQARGEKSGNSSLTEKQVREIFDDPRPSRAIARAYNISKTNVLDIKKKKIWRHLW